MRTAIDFGYTGLVAVLAGPDAVATHQSHLLTIFKASDEDEGAHIPASSMNIFGARALMALRDALLKAYPL